MNKKAKKLGGLVLGTALVYLILLIYPSVLFANKHPYLNFEIYSDRPIPNTIDLVIDDVIDRIENSELYDANDTFRIYFCNDNWRFKLFTRNGNAGGVVNIPISANIFIRESNIETNELIPPGGWMYTPKERPLSYFIAHESIHSLQRKRNPFIQLTTPSYILEGYADYIAKKPDFNYTKYMELYKTKDFLMNPENGLYHKYHLFTAYLIDKEGYSFDRIINEKPDLERTLEQAIKK